MSENICRKSARHHGFTYLGVLFLVSLLAMTASIAGALWSIEQHRANERELVFVGRQFEAAIERYHALAKGDSKGYPRRLEDLLQDDRSIKPLHHLRRIYVDPLTGSTEWGLVRLPDGGIVGVHSLSDRKPFQRKSVAPDYSVPSTESYRRWRFIAPSAAELVAEPPPGG